jgi:DNA-binding transcriptional regulator WhiA
MTTLKITVDNRKNAHLLSKLLKSMSFVKRVEEDIPVSEDTNFQEHKKYLEAELKEIIEGNATFYSVNDVEQRLEKIIKKHEDNL